MVYEDLSFYSAEAAFQSAKSTDLNIRKQFCGLSPKQAKKMGRAIRLREDWEEVKDQVMYDILKSKFSNERLRQLLLQTGNKELIENNSWNDTYWGVCNGKGQNKLGKLLMQVREELKTEA